MTKLTKYYFKIYNDRIFKEFSSYREATVFFLSKQGKAIKEYKHALCYWGNAEDADQLDREWRNDDGV